MTTHQRKAAALLCLAALGAQLAACGGTSGSQDESTAPADTTAPEAVGYPYYAGNDLGGETFTILNTPKELWNMLCVIQPEEQNGEVVNDAIFNRNERVKAALNCEIEEINDEWTDSGKSLLDKFNTAVMAGEDTYDAVWMPMHFMLSGLTDGYYQKLDDVDTIHLEEEWWDQILLDSTSVRGEHYFATSAAHLMSFDGIWCVFFNESMMDNLQLEYPYQLVRDGKWTLDAMRTYTKAAANLNGADSFAKEAGSPAVYGFTSFEHVTMKFIYGADALFVEKDAEDEPVFNGTSEKFVGALQKLNEFFATPGEFFVADSESKPATSYIKYYQDQKSLFLGAEVKAAQQLRGMEQSFGILPYPKLDEEQENYASTALHQCAVFTIPITNAAPEKVGLLFDALSWESEETVVEPYFSLLVEQKGLRNEESIEMLQIIRSTRSFDIGVSYQWVADLESTLRSVLLESNANIASVIASYKGEIETKIADMLK